MTNVFVFVPQHALGAERNLAQFIEDCRTELTIYEPNFCWEDSVWPEAGIGFYNIDQGKSSRDPRLLLQQPFLDFAKAYVRYRQTHKPNQSRYDTRALKCVERALVNMKGAADPLVVDESVLDIAAQLAREYFKQPYSAGREIALLGKFLTDHKLTRRPLDWKNPVRRPRDTHRTGFEAKKNREAKLPSQEALDAIADIFAEGPNDHSEIFVTSTVALLLCAPSRIGEIIELAADCEVEERKRDGAIAYGWRFRPKKGGPTMIKWIPDVMVDIAKEAIARVRRITQPARDLAAWLEYGGPLPDFIESLLDGRAELDLTSATALAGKSVASNLSVRSIAQAHFASTLDLLNAIRSQVLLDCPYFPHIDKEKSLKWSDLLFCFNRNQLHSQRATLPLRLWRPDNNSLNDRLGSQTQDVPSFFDRRNIVGARGMRLRVRSHQLRHLLVTISLRGGLSAQALARWRGSNDVRQNRAYDQRSEYELAAMIRTNDAALIRGSSEIEIANKIKLALPLTTEEFNTLERPTAHITEIGFCLHDFVMAPCQKFRDCINCTEQVCVKGDRRLSSLRDQLALVEQQLKAAEDGAAEGLYGADPWTHIQTQTRDRLLGLIQIIEDTAVPDGSVIRLANSNEFSPARRALRQRGLIQTTLPLIEHHTQGVDL